MNVVYVDIQERLTFYLGTWKMVSTLKVTRSVNETGFRPPYNLTTLPNVPLIPFTEKLT